LFLFSPPLRVLFNMRSKGFRRRVSILWLETKRFSMKTIVSFGPEWAPLPPPPPLGRLFNFRRYFLSVPLPGYHSPSDFISRLTPVFPVFLALLILFEGTGAPIRKFIHIRPCWKMTLLFPLFGMVPPFFLSSGLALPPPHFLVQSFLPFL